MSEDDARQIRRRNKPRQVPESTLEEIRRLHQMRLSPAEIFRELESNPSFASTVGERTVQRIVREDLEVEDTSGPWSFFDAPDPERAALALSVLTHINRYSQKRVTYLTRDEAEAIIRIRIACPRLLLHDVWEFAQDYVERKAHGQGEQELELFISHIRLDHEPSALRRPIGSIGELKLVTEDEIRNKSNG